jgi:hypothetical protein
MEHVHIAVFEAGQGLHERRVGHVTGGKDAVCRNARCVGDVLTPVTTASRSIDATFMRSAFM